ncbi:monocarboxylate transporter 5-like [Littorina saxatilis]|uniref:Uncharacterized protein n=1 Tax=Littorina saxatilis TaxID=31220 RepID=A0AAN9B3I9_9CAEN
MNLKQKNRNGNSDKSSGSAALFKMESQEEDVLDEKDGSENDGVPYDRGWAWVVMTACFVNYVVLACYFKSLSIFYVALLDKYQAPAAETALIFSIRDGVFSVSSLFIMNAVVGRLGIRTTALIGALLMSLSGILASMVNEMMPLICLQGSLFGLGHAMLISPGEVLIGSYFRKRRSLALPLAKCGSSVGNMLMPPLVTFFLQHYGLSGALLLTGALGLHCLPAAMLLRPVASYHRHRGKNARAISRQKHIGSGEGLEATELLVQNIENFEVEFKPCKSGAGEAMSREQDLARTFHSCQEQSERVKVSDAPASNSYCERVSISSPSLSRSLDVAESPDHLTEDSSGSIFLTVSDVTEQDHTAQTGHEHDSSSCVGHKKDSKREDKHEYEQTVAGSSTCTEKDSTSIKSEGRQETERNAAGSITCKEDDSESKTEGHNETPHPENDADEETVSETPSACRRLAACLGAVFCVLDFSLFASPLFRLLMAYFLLFPCINIMIIYLPALASEKGLTESDAALLLTIIGSLDIFSRLCCAFIANTHKVKVSTMIAVSFVILGVTAQFVRLMTSWAHLATLSVLLGMLAGVGNVLLPVLVVGFVGLDGMGKALGFVLLGCAAAAAAMFPLLGLIRDATGSYSMVYHVIGSGGIVAAGLLCCENWVRRLEHRQQDKHS